MISAQRRLLLAGASALAVLAGSARANSATFTGPGQHVFTAPIHGEYAIEVLGPGGGRSAVDFSGGRGAEVEGDVVLFGGLTLSVLAGGQGYSGSDGGGGGGLSLVLGPNFLAIGGGGGGAGLGGTGGPGQAGPNGQSGYGTQGGAGGQNGGGGGGGASPGLDGGGGSGLFGAGGNGQNASSGHGGRGLVGGIGYLTGSGGYGGGGGASWAGGGGGASWAGGGGAGYSGGGGGAGSSTGYGGGGGSLLYGPILDSQLSAGVNSGRGYVSVRLIEIVPETSTWAMMLAGFAGLGALALLRTRKTSPG